MDNGEYKGASGRQGINLSDHISLDVNSLTWIVNDQKNDSWLPLIWLIIASCLYRRWNTRHEVIVCLTCEVKLRSFNSYDEWPISLVMDLLNRYHRVLVH